MRFHVLGPLEVVGDDGPVRVQGHRRRALLAMLLMRPGKVVTLPGLVDGIWADDPPDSAIANIRTYVHGLRRLLHRAGDSPARLVSHPGGYHLAVREDELDLLRFHDFAADGRQAMTRGDHRRAVDRLGLALSLWRGRPLEDLLTVGAEVSAMTVALEEQRWAVASCWIDARLALGHQEELIPLLRQMVAERPLNEQTRRQLIVALRTAGRTADALSSYREARQTSIEELGIEPGTELQRVHSAILNGQSLRRPAGRTDGLPSPARWTAPAPSVLPPKPPYVVGHDAVRQRLSAIGQVVSTRSTGHAHTTVVAVSGAPGTGKSTLAVAVAYDLRHLFPDGQLYVALDGSTDRPRAPADVLGELLSALRVEPSAIPDGPRERTALFRSVVADRRVLLVLDDAGAARWVRPLLPGAGNCLVLVTSRPQLAELDVAWQGNLGPLSQDDAVRVLAGVAGWDRVMAAHDDAVRVAAACDHLPLALRIAGVRLSASPGSSLATLAERLADERGRLDELAVGDISVRGRLAQSYRALDLTTRGAFRALGRGPVPLFTSAVAAELLGRSRPAADRVLERLVRHNLLTSTTAPGGAPQYQMLTLVWLYAGECARGEPDSRDPQEAT